MALSPLTRLLLTIASVVVVLAGMRAASPVIGPVAIALLITIAWSPASQWLQRKGWPPIAASLTGILVGIVAIVLLVLLVWSSLLQLQENLPEYEPRVEALRVSINGFLARLPFETSNLLDAESLQPQAIVGYALRFIGGITSTAGNFAILVLIMAFLMIEGVRYPQKLRDAFHASAASTQRLDKFVQSMRSYVVLNTIFGLMAGAANTVLLLALGVDLAILWGVLSFLLSFLPNIGFLLALAPPALLALLQFGVARALMVVAGFTLINFLVDNVIKPRYFGGSLDISPAVVVVSLVFWGWLLGPVGALLAVPLSISARLLVESHEESQWIGHLMSDQGPSTDTAPSSAEESEKG
jgi:predicted PurR-regulated permease PerM